MRFFGKLQNRFREALESKAAKTGAAFAEKLAQIKAEWMATVMKDNLPAEIFKLADTKDEADKRKVRHWMKKHKFRIEDHPGQTEIWKGGQLISVLRARFKDGKFEVQIPKPKKDSGLTDRNSCN